MKVVVIGATGTIGKALVTALGGRHELIRVTRKLGIKVDIEDSRSIKQLFENVKPIDAVVCCAGRTVFRPLPQLTDDEPMAGGAAISMVNAGLEGFVLGASVEMPRSLRVNVVNPPWISETLKALDMDPSLGITAAAAAKAYVAAIEGNYNGQTLDARKFV